MSETKESSKQEDMNKMMCFMFTKDTRKKEESSKMNI